MQYRIEEGMHVYDKDGKKVGEVGKVVVGGASKEARLFVIEKGLLFKHDYLVPREAIERVTEDGVHISVPKDRVEKMPEYRGQPPSREEAHKAYEQLGGRGTHRGIEFDRLPFHSQGSRTGGSEGGMTGPYVVTVEEYLVLTPEERQSRGFRNDWDYTQGGAGNR